MANARIKCERHGLGIPSIVCCHLLADSSDSLGFVENSSDPYDLQAWCEGCERLFLEEGEKTQKFKDYCDFAVVCSLCYAEIKQAQHG